jgi:hypothetical protein
MRLRIFVVAIAATAVVGAATHSTAADRFQMATAQEMVTGLLQPGTVSCLGGEPAAPPLLCTPGTNQIHLRGRVESAVYLNVAGEAAALIDGTNTIVVNCNLDATLRGHCWGTFVWQIPARGGEWEGTWGGPVDLIHYVGSYVAVGHGTGGELEGLQLKVDTVAPGGTPLANLTARILFPGAE